MAGRAYRSELDLAHLGDEHELAQGYYDQGYCFRCGVICCGNGERIARDDGVRADLKKGPKRFRSDPFTACDIAPKTSDASASNAASALTLTHRFGFLDCRIVIPGVANSSFGHARGGKIRQQRCLVLATFLATSADA